MRLDFEQSLAALDKTHFIETVTSQLPSHQLLVLSDYAKGTLSDVPALIKAAKQHNIPVLVDPKGTDFSKYTGATLLTPNLAEFEAVVGPIQNERDLVTKGQALLKTLALEALLITRSEQGMTLIRADQEELHLPTKAKEVYDVTGAGDSFIATLSLAIASKATEPTVSKLIFLFLMSLGLAIQ